MSGYAHKNYYVGASDKKLCQDAISIQDASNLVGVVNTLKDMIIAVRERDEDWKASSTHPAVRMVILKIQDMARMRTDYDEYSFYYNECKEVIKNDSIHNE